MLAQSLSLDFLREWNADFGAVVVRSCDQKSGVRVQLGSAHLQSGNAAWTGGLPTFSPSAVSPISEIDGREAMFASW